MKYDITRYHICVPLTCAQWKRLRRIEDADDGGKRTRPNDATFNAVLKKCGAERIEFNGHFGMNFFFEVETLAEADAVTATFKQILDRTHPCCLK